ncbi:ZIP family metal transporter [Neobacillus muris]|uniref:ZIP family metal transporter n=1 Tax=Neobacillus muris TaxID=2941334 RepID=UPI00203E7EB1|nr:ZIP family metal transporter [Neobacillus muris]
MIEDIKISFLITLLIFGAMFLGGLTIRLMFLFLNKNTVYLQILCGGLLTGLFVFELLPDTFSHFQTIGIFTGISAGIFIMITTEVLLHNNSSIHRGNHETVYLLLVALIIHSIPTGVTFGMSLQLGQLMNYGLLTAFILHHIPEGMIIMGSFPNIQGKNSLFIFNCFILSIMIGINIFLGQNIRIDSLKWNTVLMGMTLGTMSYVTFYELLWKKSRNLPKGKVALIVLIGMIGMHYFIRFLPSHQ